MGASKFFLYAYTRPFQDLKKVGSLIKDVTTSQTTSEASKVKPEGFDDAMKKRADIVRSQLPLVEQKIKGRIVLIRVVALIAALWGVVNLLTLAVDLRILFSSSGGSMPYQPLLYVAVCTALVFGCFRWTEAEKDELLDTIKHRNSSDEMLMKWVGDLDSTYSSMLMFKRVLLVGILVVSCYLVSSIVNMNLMNIIVCASIVFFMGCMNLKYSLYLFQIREKRLAPLQEYLSGAFARDFFNPEL